MKKNSAVLAVGAGAFLLFGGLGFRATFAAKPVLADAKKTNIVLNMACSINDGSIPAIYGSAGAPNLAFTLSTHCAQAISDLSKVGFNIGSATSQVYTTMVYTLEAPFGVQPAKKPVDVVILTCWSPTTGDTLIFGDSSAGSPTFSPSTDCSQDLASLAAAGYKLSFTGFGNGGNQTIFVDQRQ